MSHTIKLDSPDEIYEFLNRQAVEAGKSVEDFAAACLSAGAPASGQDSLLQLAGVLESEVTDVAHQHDRYIGHLVAAVPVLGRGWNEDNKRPGGSGS
jgi:hypothetical protein